MYISRVNLLGAVWHILELLGQPVIAQLVVPSSRNCHRPHHLPFPLSRFSSGVCIIRYPLRMETASTFAQEQKKQAQEQ